MGKKNPDDSKTESYGVLYPDGSIVWDEMHYHRTNLDELGTPEGRAEFFKEWERMVRDLRLADAPRPIIVKRTKKITYSTYVPVIDG